MLEITLNNEIQHENEQILSNQTNIIKIDASELTYQDFFTNYMQKNVPVIITSIASEWECFKNWQIVNNNKDDNNNIYIDSNKNNNNNNQQDPTEQIINFEYLLNHIQNHIVPVANCTKQYFNSHEKLQLNFHDFINNWKTNSLETISKTVTTETFNIKNTNDKCELNGNNYCDILKNDDSSTNNKLLYLKDWHLSKEQPNYEFYKIPKYFASDWLNEYFTESTDESIKDDYKFVYMGPKGTWTPFHADVFSSYSWSTNICGTKLWLILQPNEEKKLYDKFRNLPFSIDESILQLNNCKYYRILQLNGEAIFIPSNWYHQVWNLTDTISVNHNWFNGCNIMNIWYALESHYESVLKEINDCKDMPEFMEHSQMMLKASYGMNYHMFLNILKFIVDKRMNTLKKCPTINENILINNFQFGKTHLAFDINSILNVLQKMIKNDAIFYDIDVKLLIWQIQEFLRLI